MKKGYVTVDISDDEVPEQYNDKEIYNLGVLTSWTAPELRNLADYYNIESDKKNLRLSGGKEALAQEIIDAFESK